MAKIFKNESKNEKKEKGSFLETFATIAAAGLYVAAAVATADPEYDAAVNVVNRVVSKYDSARRISIPASDWDRMLDAEKVFEKNAFSKDDAVDNAMKIHRVLISNRRAGGTRPDQEPKHTNDNAVMDIDKAESLYTIYSNKYNAWTSKSVFLTVSEKEQMSDAAVTLRKHGLSARAQTLEMILAKAL